MLLGAHTRALGRALAEQGGPLPDGRACPGATDGRAEREIEAATVGTRGGGAGRCRVTSGEETAGTGLPESGPVPKRAGPAAGGVGAVVGAGRQAGTIVGAESGEMEALARHEAGAWRGNADKRRVHTCSLTRVSTDKHMRTPHARAPACEKILKRTCTLSLVLKRTCTLSRARAHRHTHSPRARARARAHAHKRTHAREHAHPHAHSKRTRKCTKVRLLPSLPPSLPASLPPSLSSSIPKLCRRICRRLLTGQPDLRAPPIAPLPPRPPPSLQKAR